MECWLYSDFFHYFGFFSFNLQNLEAHGFVVLIVDFIDHEMVQLGSFFFHKDFLNQDLVQMSLISLLIFLEWTILINLAWRLIERLIKNAPLDELSLFVLDQLLYKVDFFVLILSFFDLIDDGFVI